MAEQVGVGMVGLGTVGSAVARRLIDEWELLGRRAGVVPVLRRVAVRDPSRRRAVDLSGVRIDDDVHGLVDDPSLRVVVEVMGGVDAAASLMERALRAGKQVVTANKAAVAVHGIELARLARDCGTSLRYEAAVGGGLPVVALLRDSLRGDRITALEAIINGTTNIMLTAMERDAVGFDAALDDAQRRGFAEADPSADVDGFDAAAKLVLLSRIAFDSAVTLDDVAVTGIRGIEPADVACARAFGGSVKLVAHAVLAHARVALSVRPTVVLASHPLHGVDDSANALVVTSDLAQRVVVEGVGGGGESTASAVVSDIVAAVRAPAESPPVPSEAATAADPGEVERAGCVRVVVGGGDDAERLAVQALEDRGVPVVATAPVSCDGTDWLAIVTAPVQRAALARAAETLDSLATVRTLGPVLECAGTP